MSGAAARTGSLRYKKKEKAYIKNRGMGDLKVTKQIV